MIQHNNRLSNSIDARFLFLLKIYLYGNKITYYYPKWSNKERWNAIWIGIRVGRRSQRLCHSIKPSSTLQTTLCGPKSRGAAAATRCSTIEYQINSIILSYEIIPYKTASYTYTAHTFREFILFTLFIA